MKASEVRSGTAAKTDETQRERNEEESVDCGDDDVDDDGEDGEEIDDVASADASLIASTSIDDSSTEEMSQQ